MQTNYPAFFFRDDSNVTVVFPDLPGCLTFAATVSEAFTAAQRILHAHVLAMVSQDMPIPTPSDLLAVRPASEDVASLICTQLVPVTTPGKTVRTNITIDEALLGSIDAVTSNRSVFFAEAAQRELVRRRSA